MPPNRKRLRNIQEEESLEFMPLSKRINNLHINNPRLQGSALDWGPGPPACNCSSSSSCSHPLTPPHSLPEWQNPPPQYNPELSESQNPFYYTSNKLLFDLYIERVQRYGHTALDV